VLLPSGAVKVRLSFWLSVPPRGGPDDRWLAVEREERTAEPSGRFDSCMSGVVTMGQSLRQREGRLSAEREISLRRTGGAVGTAEGVVGEKILIISPVGVRAWEKVDPQRRPRALSGMTTLGVVAQVSGCSTTGVRSMDLERRRWMYLLPVCRMWEREVMW
jgi:hypothetical protein